MSGRARALMGWLAPRQGEMADLLARLARAESPTLPVPPGSAAWAVVAAELTASGLVVRRLPGRAVGDHLYARPAGRRRGAPRQLVVGHLDTVWPLGTLASMPVSEREGRLHGPGVFDMKAGLVQLIYALRALGAADMRPDVTPVVLVNADEEVGSPDSGRWIRALARLSVRAYVLEPAMGSAGRLKTARKGVGRFVITVRGRPAHAGIDPERGVSAILELSHQIQRLFALNDPDRGVTVNVGTIDGGLRPNVVAPEATAVIDARVPTHDDAVALEAALRALAPADDGATIHVEGGFGRPPMPRTERNRALWHAAASAAEELGIPLAQAAVGGASDGNTTSQITATLDGLGPVGDGAHAVHEHVRVARMPERAALLALLLMAPP